jgi:hypothetical protein
MSSANENKNSSGPEPTPTRSLSVQHLRAELNSHFSDRTILRLGDLFCKLISRFEDRAELISKQIDCIA